MAKLTMTLLFYEEHAEVAQRAADMLKGDLRVNPDNTRTISVNVPLRRFEALLDDEARG